MGGKASVHITILAHDGCMASSIYNTIDFFKAASELHGRGKRAPFSKIEVISVDGNRVIAHNKLVVQPDMATHEVERADLVVVPGFSFFSLEIPDIPYKTLSFLRRMHQNGSILAAMCTGSFLLAEAGLLDGKVATTSWLVADIFEKRYPSVQLHRSRMVTDDSHILCSGSITAYLNMFLYIIEKYVSREAMLFCSKAMLIDPGKESQAPYMAFIPKRTHQDKTILMAQEYMETRFGTALTIEEVARHVGLGLRQFRRRFKEATGESPIGYIQLIRIDHAKRLLEEGTLSLSEITWKVGYEDISSFRKLFKRATGIPPSRYRNQFHSPSFAPKKSFAGQRACG
ncbi:MAG: helix-turn-helix domain-containing protein [Desulfobacterales bacterium]|nr:helix-turn-helix domain-containing protein [Desulfobacterales bacterium]